jgi:hypothetical protein
MIEFIFKKLIKIKIEKKSRLLGRLLPPPPLLTLHTLAGNLAPLVSAPHALRVRRLVKIRLQSHMLLEASGTVR